MLPLWQWKCHQTDGHGSTVDHGRGPHGSVQGASGGTASTGAIGKKTTTFKEPYGEVVHTTKIGQHLCPIMMQKTMRMEVQTNTIFLFFSYMLVECSKRHRIFNRHT